MSRRRGQRPKRETCLARKPLTLVVVATVVLMLVLVLVLTTFTFIGSRQTASPTKKTSVTAQHDNDRDQDRKLPPFRNKETESSGVTQKQTTTTTTTTATADVTLVECVIVTKPAAAAAADGNSNMDMDTADTANGVLHITVRHDLSPIASAVFVDLVQAHYFDGVFMFRVLKGFVAQWGMLHKDLIERKNTIPKPSNTKDTIHDKTLSNVRGTLSFAGGNPATMQVFVNLKHNVRLDRESSRPFATVDDASMKQVLDRLYTGYKDGQGQAKALHRGETAVREEFPHMSQVERCRVV
jgi:cyclophilin family peptidyl-prolyl cis-trans isomerase